jgi:hypothetical protein
MEQEAQLLIAIIVIIKVFHIIQTILTDYNKRGK